MNALGETLQARADYHERAARNNRTFSASEQHTENLLRKAATALESQDEQIAALRELVRLKDIKEWLESREPPYDHDHFKRQRLEYDSKKDAAWQAARAALVTKEKA